MKKTFPADPASLYPVREFVRSAASNIALSGAFTDELVLAVSEACSLVLRHSLDPVLVLSWEVGLRGVEISVEDQNTFEPWNAKGTLSDSDCVLIAEQVDFLDVSVFRETGRAVLKMSKRIDDGEEAQDVQNF
jgi:anti-sigma regulatory factor (Ser/Thr protein kinase)